MHDAHTTRQGRGRGCDRQSDQDDLSWQMPMNLRVESRIIGCLGRASGRHISQRALSGPWERRASQGCQARPEEAREPTSGTTKGGGAL